jgi:hypothetical protein
MLRDLRCLDQPASAQTAAHLPASARESRYVAQHRRRGRVLCIFPPYHRSCGYARAPSGASGRRHACIAALSRGHRPVPGGHGEHEGRLAAADRHGQAPARSTCEGVRLGQGQYLGDGQSLRATGWDASARWPGGRNICGRALPGRCTHACPRGPPRPLGWQ